MTDIPKPGYRQPWKDVGDALIDRVNAMARPPGGIVGDGVTDDSGAFNAAVAAADVGDVIDLDNKTLFLGSTILLSKRVTVRNGAFTAAGRRCFTVNAAGVRFERVSFTRTTTTRSNEGAAVYVQAEDFESDHCTYASAAGPPLYLQHASASGARISGGYCYPQLAYQDTAGIYVAAGSTGNTDIVIDGVTVQGNGASTNGISIYDSAHCVVRNCVIDTCTKLPDVSITSGWSLVSGNVYRIADRTDGLTRAVWIGATEYTENTSTPTTPGANEWGISGGFLYFNLGGTNPNTVTVISQIVSGYGVMFYNTTSGYAAMSDNRVENNMISNTDGFGIYLQLAGASATTARRNSTLNNELLDVCLTGVQSGKLPFAGFGVNGGLDSSFMGDRIARVGAVGTPASGFRVNPVSAASSGVVMGMHVAEATKSGITMPSGQWKFVGCSADRNTVYGFEVFNGQGTDLVDATLVGCSATGNGTHGVVADASIVSGSNYRVTIIGGAYHGNTVRNIALKSVRDSRVIGTLCYGPGSGQYNIQIDTNCTRVIVDGNSIVTGNGISIASSATDVVLGANTIASGFTALSLGTVVRIAGTVGAGAEFTGAGTPEAAVTAGVGATYRRTDGGAGTTLYVKESGTGNTGWVAK